MFGAVVLAGERPGGSMLGRQLGLASSVLADVAGKPALRRVIEALESAELIGKGIVCGPSEEVFQSNPEFEQILAGSGFEWLAPRAGPSASAIHGLRTLGSYPALLTAGDHALLTAELVDSFCSSARTVGGDVVVGLAPYPTVHAAFPDSRRTVQKYRDGAYCGTNLYAVMNPRGLTALDFWQVVEAQRKRPWKIAGKLGFAFLLRYLLRRVTLQSAFDRVSSLCSCKVSYVLVDSARAAVDVDSPADRDLAERILRGEVTGC